MTDRCLLTPNVTHPISLLTIVWPSNVSNYHKKSSKKLDLFDNSASLVLCDGNPPVSGGIPSQRVSDAESFPLCDVTMIETVLMGFRVIITTIMTRSIPSCL